MKNATKGIEKGITGQKNKMVRRKKLKYDNLIVASECPKDIHECVRITALVS